jgi:hypothetical protein
MVKGGLTLRGHLTFGRTEIPVKNSRASYRQAEGPEVTER